MKKFLSRKNGIALLSILAIGVFFLVPNHTHAIDWLNLAGITDSLVYGTLGKILLWGLLMPLSKILMLAGGVLDIVVKFSLNSRDLYLSHGVEVGWTAFRDICNMIFIFVLIVASIKTIFQSKIPKDTIKNVILAAITINFSLYVTKFILDIANIVAVWLYNAILGLVGGANGLGTAIVGVMNISRFFGTGSAVTPERINDASAFLAVIVLSIVTILVIIMVFKSTSLFLSRTIAFVFHMIMSPLGLMSKFGLIPESFAKKYDWWDSVKTDALMPVVFFLLLYISLYFTSSIQDTFIAKAKQAEQVRGADGIAWVKTDAMQKGNTFEFSDFIIFLLIYMLFNQCYKISKEYTSSIAKEIEGYAKGAAGLAAGVVGVGALGTLGKMAASSASLQGAAVTKPWARMALRAADKAQRSDFGVSGALKNIKNGDGKQIFTDKSPIVGNYIKDVAKGGKQGIEDGATKRYTESQEALSKLLGKGAAGDSNRSKYAEALKNGGGESPLFTGGILSMSDKLKNKVVNNERAPEWLRDVVKSGITSTDSIRSGASEKITTATDKDFDKNAQKEVDKAVKKKMDEKQKNGKSYTEERDEIEAARVTHAANASLVKVENEKEIKKRNDTIEELKKEEEKARKKIEDELELLKKERDQKSKEAPKGPNLSEMEFIQKTIKETIGQTEEEHIVKELKEAGFDDEKKLVGGIQPQDYTAAKEKKITDIKAAYTTKVVQKTAEAKAAYTAQPQAQAFVKHKAEIEKINQDIAKNEVAITDSKKKVEEYTLNTKNEIAAMENGIAIGELGLYKEVGEKIKGLEELTKLGEQQVGEDTNKTARRKELLEKRDEFLKAKESDLGKKWQRAQARKTGKILKDGKEEELFGLTEAEAKRVGEIHQKEREIQEIETQNINDTAGFRTTVSTGPNGEKVYSYTKDAYTSYKDLFGKVEKKDTTRTEANRKKAEEKLAADEKKEESKPAAEGGKN